MKRIFISLLLGIFYLFPCISQVTNESESNDTFEEANTVIFPGTLYTSMGDEGDKDYFKINMAGPGVLTFKISDVPADQYIEFKVYNSEKSQIAVQDSEELGKGLSHDVMLPAGISYFLIRDENFLVSSNPLKIEIALDDSDACEINNSFETACLVSPNSVLHPQIFGMNDELGRLGGHDWEFYMLELDQSGVLNIDLSNLAENQFIQLSVFDAEEEQVGYVESPSEGVGFNYDMLLPAGISYIRIKDGSNQSDSTHLNLVLSLDTSEPFEPNNSFETAAIISADTVLYLKLRGYNDEINGFRKTDVDFFKIPGGLCLNQCINVSSLHPSQKIRMYVYDSDLVQIGFEASPNDGIGFDYCMDITSGEYYVKIMDYNNNSLSDSIRVEFNCSIRLGIDDKTALQNDDIIVYPNPSPGKIRIKFPAASEKLYVLNMEGQIVESRMLNGEEVIDLQIYNRGIYFIRIKNKYGFLNRKVIIAGNNPAESLH